MEGGFAFLAVGDGAVEVEAAEAEGDAQEFRDVAQAGAGGAGGVAGFDRRSKLRATCRAALRF